MKSVVLFSSFFILVVSNDAIPSETLGTYLYKELGCVQKSDGNSVQYQCPDFLPKNGSCMFKNKLLNVGDQVDREELKGSCHAKCQCGYDGHIVCAHYDCFERLKSGCSHFKYSLDSCCPIDSVCGPIANCEIEETTYQEGNTVFLKEKCEVCVCDYKFEMKSPFCRPRKCYDQATFTETVEKNGAPVFFKDENCCPNIWLADEGQEVVQINEKSDSESGLSCKFGERKVPLGYGFKTKVQPYGREVPLVCECNMPPLLICKEQI